MLTTQLNSIECPRSLSIWWTYRGWSHYLYSLEIVFLVHHQKPTSVRHCDLILNNATFIELMTECGVLFFFYQPMIFLFSFNIVRNRDCCLKDPPINAVLHWMIVRLTQNIMYVRLENLISFLIEFHQITCLCFMVWRHCEHDSHWLFQIECYRVIAESKQISNHQFLPNHHTWKIHTTP